MYIILMYDIVMDDVGTKVQRNVFKICKRYLNHVQMSVFEGELTKAQIEKLHVELKKYIRQDKDSLIIFKSRNEKWLDKEFWGNKKNEITNFL